MAASPSSWRGTRGLDDVDLKVIKESTTRLAALETGDIDFTTGLPIPELDRIDAFDNIVLGINPSTQWTGWSMEYFDPPTKDVRVRLALQHALDTKTVIEELYFGRAVEQRSQPLTENTFGFNPNLQPYGYDPDKSRQLLKDAGLPDGFKTTITSRVEGNPVFESHTLAAANDIGEIGIDIGIEHVETGVWRDGIYGRAKRTPHIYHMPFSAFVLADASFAYSWLLKDAPSAYYDNPKFESKFLEGLSTIDTEARRKLYQEATAEMAADPPALWTVPRGGVPRLAGGQVHQPLPGRAACAVLRPGGSALSGRSRTKIGGRPRGRSSISHRRRVAIASRERGDEEAAMALTRGRGRHAPASPRASPRVAEQHADDATGHLAAAELFSGVGAAALLTLGRDAVATRHRAGDVVGEYAATGDETVFLLAAGGCISIGSRHEAGGWRGRSRPARCSSVRPRSSATARRTRSPRPSTTPWSWESRARRWPRPSRRSRGRCAAARSDGAARPRGRRRADNVRLGVRARPGRRRPAPPQQRGRRDSAALASADRRAGGHASRDDVAAPRGAAGRGHHRVAAARDHGAEALSPRGGRASPRPEAPCRSRTGRGANDDDAGAGIREAGLRPQPARQHRVSGGRRRGAAHPAPRHSELLRVLRRRVPLPRRRAALHRDVDDGLRRVRPAASALHEHPRVRAVRRVADGRAGTGAGQRVRLAHRRG